MSQPQMEHVAATVAKQVRADCVDSLRAVRDESRQARRQPPEVLSADTAEYYDLNSLAKRTVHQILPVCRVLSIPVQMQLEPRLPAIPMLVQPTEEALSSMLDICLDSELAEHIAIRVQTCAWRNRAVALVERRTTGISSFAPWRDVGTLGRVELIVGVETSRAVGGRMRVFRRADELRLWLELPLCERLGHPFRASREQSESPLSSTRRLDLPGPEQGPWPQTGG